MQHGIAGAGVRDHHAHLADDLVAAQVLLVPHDFVDRRQYLEILTSTLFDAPVYKTYGGLIASGLHTMSVTLRLWLDQGVLRLQQIDLGHAAGAAGQCSHAGGAGREKHRAKAII